MGHSEWLAVGRRSESNTTAQRHRLRPALHHHYTTQRPLYRSQTNSKAQGTQQQPPCLSCHRCTATAQTPQVYVSPQGEQQGGWRVERSPHDCDWCWTLEKTKHWYLLSTHLLVLGTLRPLTFGLSILSRDAYDGSWCYSDHLALPAQHILYTTVCL